MKKQTFEMSKLETIIQITKIVLASVLVISSVLTVVLLAQILEKL